MTSEGFYLFSIEYMVFSDWKMWRLQNHCPSFLPRPIRECINKKNTRSSKNANNAEQATPCGQCAEGQLHAQDPEDCGYRYSSSRLLLQSLSAFPVTSHV